MEMYPTSIDSDSMMLDSIRRYLLGESPDFRLTVSNDCTNTTAPPLPPTMFCRSSSFSRLYPCRHVDDLPLKENDSEYMLVFGFLRDALTVGWAPSDNSSSTNSPLIKHEPQESSERVEAVLPAVVPAKGKHYRGVRQRPWGKLAAEIRDPVDEFYINFNMSKLNSCKCYLGRK